MIAIGPGNTLAALWFGWIASWMLAALVWSDRAAKVQARGGVTRVATIVGAFLMIMGARTGPRLWPLTGELAWILVAVVAAGLAFTWWARLHLGRYWAESVSRKAEHRLIDTGPYALVRHPIYTGLIVALGGTAALAATPLVIAGFALMLAAFYLRAREEEAFLTQELGAAVYQAYRTRTGMLLPLLGRARTPRV